MDIKARLQLFYVRLGAAPAANTHDEAFALIAAILNAVEDEHSGLPNKPSRERDGRMYPPQMDSVREVKGSPGVLRYRNSNHNTFIASNGAIEVQQIKPKEVQFTKAGANGKGVWDVQDPANK